MCLRFRRSVLYCSVLCFKVQQYGNKYPTGIWLALDNGADINKQDLGGVTALMHAAFEGQAAAAEVEALIQRTRVSCPKV